MSELNGEVLDYRHSPESNDNLTAYHRYNDTILQFRVLQKMGYPVELQDAWSADIADDVWPGDEYFQYQRKMNPILAKPVILDPTFEQWVETPDVQGDQIVVGEFDELISDHPMKIVAEVSMGDAGVFKYYLDELESEGKVPYVCPHDEGILTEELLERCLVGSMERREEKISDPDAPQYIPDISDETVQLYDRLVSSGTPPVTEEELMALYFDYYSLVERLRP